VGIVLFIVNTGAVQDLPDLSEVVLTPQDFPQDFVELSPDQLGLQVGQSAEGDLDIESAFGLLRSEPFEMIWGFTGLLPTKSEQASFDRDTRRQHAMLASLVQEMEAEEGDILEQAVLSDLEVIGDASLGVTIVVDSGDAILRLDVVGFRRDTVGAFVYVLYLDGEIRLVPVDDVARKLDAHIIEALH
jgi:hypothetical protein